MSFLSMMEARLPPGFRFHPRDEELVCDYLAKRASGERSFPMMIDVDLNKCEPWDLPDMACVGGKEWYFFNLRDRKYATGQRTNRATQSGYWKATGKDRQVFRRGLLVGMRKTLVFYQGRAPKGKKTDWVMHEFRIEDSGDLSKFASFKEDWVLCRVFYKSRAISNKPGMETSYDETSSCTLPTLMDNYITFDQASVFTEGNEQVPCFSNPSPNHAAQSNSIPQRTMPTKTTTQLGGFNTESCDKKVIQVVLNHLSKLEGNKREVTPSMEQGSLESYLPETGLPSIWNSF